MLWWRASCSHPFLNGISVISFAFLRAYDLQREKSKIATFTQCVTHGRLLWALRAVKKEQKTKKKCKKNKNTGLLYYYQLQLHVVITSPQYVKNRD